jgi:preprotein translocase subunit SecD
VFDESTAPTLDELITQPEQDDPEKAVILPSSDGTEIYLLGPSEASGVIVGDANATFTNEWFVSVEFTDEGSAVWDAIAQANLGRQLGIVLDGAVESAPTIQTTEFGGSARITGDFDQQRAEDLALVLRFGALPVELEPQTVQQVSATLGEDALQAGIIAGLIGLVLVSVYMLLNYRLLGVVAICSLLVSTGMLWFLISWLGETQGLALSLSGAVGIILSIGVAVDSNVGSFDDAFSTIVKADVASLIGAIILFTLTIGAVRGFALYLAIATVIDMLVSYVFMRPMVLWVVRTYASQDPKRLGVTLRPTEPPAAAQAEVMS